MRKLDALERMATRTFSEDSSLLITLLRAVADRYVHATIHNPIVQLSDSTLAGVAVLPVLHAGNSVAGAAFYGRRNAPGLTVF
jgi:hypothetical protein